MGGEKWCQPIGLKQVQRMEGEFGGQCSWRETVHDRGNSNRCDCQTQEDIHVSEVRGGRAGIRLINGPSKKSNQTEEVVAQRYRMVEIPGEEMGYTGTEWRGAGQGHVREEVDR